MRPAVVPRDTVRLYTSTTRFTAMKIATYEMWTDFCRANGIVFQKNTGGAERPSAAIIADAKPEPWGEFAFAVKYVVWTPLAS
jgi:hypothetical protein